MFKILPQSKGAIIACKASGMICEFDYDAILPEFENRIKEALRFRLLLDWVDLEGWEPQAGPARFGVRMMHRWRCERLAIVTADPSRTDDIKLLEVILPRSTELRVFPPNEHNAAWSWLTSD